MVTEEAVERRLTFANPQHIFRKQILDKTEPLSVTPLLNLLKKRKGKKIRIVCEVLYVISKAHHKFTN